MGAVVTINRMGGNLETFEVRHGVKLSMILETFLLLKLLSNSKLLKDVL